MQPLVPLVFHNLPSPSFITRVRAGEVGGAHNPKWRRSLLIRAETTRDVGLEKNDRLGTMHTSDHRRSVWY